MATLIPALGTCVSRMTTGERRLGERLEQKLDDDYLAWYDVPIGPKQWHPDFVVLHPRRGLLILEVKDWRLDTLRQVDPEVWEIAPDGVPKNVPNPFVQARHYAHEVVNALERDARLVEPEGPYKGRLCFPWSYGVVLTRITRKQFEAAGLGSAIEPHRVLCSDEMTESGEADLTATGGRHRSAGSQATRPNLDAWPTGWFDAQQERSLEPQRLPSSGVGRETSLAKLLKN